MTIPEHDPTGDNERLAAAERIVLDNSSGFDGSLHDPVEIMQMVEDNIVNQSDTEFFDGALLDVAAARGADPTRVAELRSTLLDPGDAPNARPCVK